MRRGCFILLLVFITLVLGLNGRTPPVQPYAVPAADDIYTVVSGTWASARDGR